MIVKDINVHYPNYGSILLEGYRIHENWYKTAEIQTKTFWVNSIKPDWNILDIGANIGMYSVLFSKLAHKGKVVCFEPTPTSEMLIRTLNYNNVSNCSVYKQAVSDKVGVHKDRLQMIWKTKVLDQNFDFITIDHFCKTNNFIPDAIKIDIDGYDPEALYGAKKTLLEQNPIIVVELNPEALGYRGHKPKDAVEFMKSLEYSLKQIMDGENYLFVKEKK